MSGDASSPSDDRRSLRLDRDGPVAVLTLDRPERLNALSHDLLVELRMRLRALDEDRGVRAIVLTGAGRAFCAGADLQSGPSDAESVLRTYYNPLISEMSDLRTPMIAAVNGVAAGAAVSLALACDLRIASENASFRLSFVRVGLVPDAGSTWLLPRAVGTARAAEMALLGRPVHAAEALDWGLVNEVTPVGEVGKRALELAREVSALSSSVGPTRLLLSRGLGVDLAEQLNAEAAVQGRVQGEPDYQEARRAFAEKRSPRFRHS
ncbi:enoyl-CoA hydratase/isomerase family protein [Streptomyces arenae]|uniref:enoyl-CoA hydratase/isomerase family protein n=1 Tax=Streptomyces arenae TaxID=29301 RepID=UPI0026581876|nr:enoyl-CoA hydratase-related protein [Streptomyces arenae]MCG7207419.1 enoyl-CoA hydratase-related protein [Streptomyces arenae]